MQSCEQHQVHEFALERTVKQRNENEKREKERLHSPDLSNSTGVYTKQAHQT